MTAALNLPDKQDWTVDDLASLPRDLRYELVDGRLISPSPTAIHQDIALEVLLALRAQCPPGLLVVYDLSLKVDSRNEPRLDVVVIRPDHADVTPLPVQDAVLAVEVVSTWSLIRDMYAKATVYAAAGVRSYWVIQPTEDATVLTEFPPGGQRRLRDLPEHRQDLHHRSAVSGDHRSARPDGAPEGDSRAVPMIG